MKEDLKDLYQLLKDSFKDFFTLLKAGEFSDVKVNHPNQSIDSQLLNSNSNSMFENNYTTDPMYSYMKGNIFNHDD